MSNSNRRKRSDSAAAAVAAMRAASEGVIDPPSYVKLSDAARPFWDAVILTRAADSWTPGDLVLAAQLARVNADIEFYTQVAADESRLMAEDDGKPKVHPVHKVLTDLIAQSQSLSRSLQVHARATQGESRDQQKRNQLHQTARQAHDGLNDESLIARPMH